MSSVLKFALILIAAAVLALGARVMYINSLSPKQAADPEVRVLSAVGDLPAGLLLREGDLAWLAVARSKMPKGALQEGSPQADVAGALLRRKLEAGAVLQASDIIRADAPGFLAAALQPGMLAVSVPINDVSGNAGLIQPGDYVDMILTQNLGGGGDFGGDKQVVSETVVEQVRVIAVGGSFQRSDGSDAQRARTVTIEVRPRIAEAVTVASQLGSLSLALRSFAKTDASATNDEASVVAWDGTAQGGASGPVWGSDISRARQNRLAKPASQPSSTPAEPAPAAASVGQQMTRSISVIRGIDIQNLELPPAEQASHAQN